MCGLVGIFDPRDARPMDGAVLRRMNLSINHRGPDGDGEHLGPGIALAHRRLAIIDVGGGHQPLYNEDGSVVVVFNGEIYNFQELAAELEALGHIFRTHSDTEVIVHAWESWGPASVERFRGMFAFALWDEKAETLFLARDRLGKKPLYYADMPDGTLAFGSELKALRAHPATPCQLDPQAVECFFAYGYVPDPLSIYRAIRKLPPAHRLIWRRGGAPRMEAYWDLPMGKHLSLNVNEAAEELRPRLAGAIRMRMISDVPLGAFLSGGVDSSAVVALMAGASSDPVRTFSISFGDASFDESAYARRMAERYHTNHVSREVSPDDLDLLDRLAAIYDEPFGDPSAMPTYAVCKVARERVTVALSGDGGDELFGGYRRYAMHVRAEKIRRLLPQGLRKPVFGALGRVYPKADWAPRWLRARTTFRELAEDTAGAYFNAVSVLDDYTRARLFSDEARRQMQGYRAGDLLRKHVLAAPTDDPLLQIQYADMKTWLPGGILVKVDRASMANSLEVRAPLLDHCLAEWAALLPSVVKLDKAVLKRAAEPLVDRDLLYRPKQGFSMPLRRWFKGPLRARIAMLAHSPALAGSGLFNLAEIARMAEQHQAGLRDHSAGLWLLLMFEAFLKHQDR
ncbi:MAG: amidotransferase 1, exosortase A system-associated [Rhodospirillaceae bacterium]|nr:amidotransferase 1, exosortase A system-associated [Rhodospirillales bacterium]